MKKLFSIIFVIACFVFTFFIKGILSDTIQADGASSTGTSVFTQKVTEAKQKLKKEFPSIKFDISDGIHDWYIQLIYEIFTVLPEKHVKNVKEIIIKEFDAKKFPVRGAVSFSVISSTPEVKMRLNTAKLTVEAGFNCSTVEQCLQDSVTNDAINREFVGVVVHEMGHAIDLGKSTVGTSKSGKSPNFNDNGKPFYKDDPSVKHFYPICFESPKKTYAKKSEPQDFVSGYAKRDIFEDFGETMTVYVLDGANFYETALTRKQQGKDKLMQKYNFFKDQIFNGREFHMPAGDFRNMFVTFDTTKRRYSLREFLKL